MAKKPTQLTTQTAGQARDIWGDSAENFRGREVSSAVKISTEDRMFKLGDTLLGNAGKEFWGIILDFSYVKMYYGKQVYVKGTHTNPLCTAISSSPDEAVWVPTAGGVAVQSATCSACPQNAYGTSKTGKGKACTDKRRLVVIVADSLKTQGALDPAKIELATIEIPPTGLKNWIKYLKYVTDVEALPPYGVVTKFTFDTESVREIVQFTAHSFVTDPAAAGAIKALLDDAHTLAVKEYVAFSQTDAEVEATPKARKSAKKKVSKKTAAKKKAVKKKAAK